jgi:hypothetical protein
MKAMKTAATYAVMLLVVLVFGIAGCWAEPDEDDTQGLRDAVGALPDGVASRLLWETRTDIMCRALLESLDARGAFSTETPSGGTGVYIAQCFTTDEMKTTVDYIADRATVAALCKKYPGDGLFYAWWFKAIEADVATKVGKAGQRWDCITAPGDAPFRDAVNDAENAETYRTLDTIDALIKMLLVGAVPELALEAHAPKLLTVLRACTLAQTSYCIPSNGSKPSPIQPNPWTQPGQPNGDAP